MTLATLHASYGMVNIEFLKYVLAMSIDRIYAYRQIVCNLFRQLGNFWIAEPEKMNIPGSKGWDSNYPRVTTWAVMLDKVSGKRFFYMSTHLDHIGRDARHEGAVTAPASGLHFSRVVMFSMWYQIMSRGNQYLLVLGRRLNQEQMLIFFRWDRFLMI